MKNQRRATQVWADLPLTFELPTDLARHEAERLASLIRTLPIEEEA